MNWRSIFVITLTILNFCALKSLNNQFQCRKYNFTSNFNLNMEERIVVLYNAEVYTQYLRKLPFLEDLHLRLTDANFTDLQFVMLTQAPNESVLFTELSQKTGNVTIIFLQNIRNNIFLPGWVYIFDRCSRLIYDLAPQLSEMDIYIKASILSAWYDSICGNCEEYLEDNYFDEAEHTPFNSTNNDSFDNEASIFDDGNISKERNQISTSRDILIPLRIILPVTHVAKCDNCSFYAPHNYTVLFSNDSLFYQYLPSRNVHFLTEEQHSGKNTFQNNTNEPVINTSYLISSEGNNLRKVLSIGLEMKSTAYGIKLFENIKNKYSAHHIITDSLGGSNIYEISGSFHSWLSFHLIEKNKWN